MLHVVQERKKNTVERTLVHYDNKNQESPCFIILKQKEHSKITRLLQCICNQQLSTTAIIVKMDGNRTWNMKMVKLQKPSETVSLLKT